MELKWEDKKTSTDKILGPTEEVKKEDENSPLAVKDAEAKNLDLEVDKSKESLEQLDSNEV